MRLQIRQLIGPDEIRLGNSTESCVSEETPDNDSALFTCTFNRDYDRDIDTDYLSATLLFYDERGSYIQNRDQNLTVPENMIRDNQFHFELSPPPNLSGTFFHVQAIIRDTITTADDVSYEVSSYHTTMKRIYIYTEKRFLQVYWSGKEVIGEENTQEDLITETGENEDAFLHIKAQGMYRETVTLIIHADNVPLVERTVTLHNNRKSIAIRISDIRGRYDREGKDFSNVSITATTSIRDPRRQTPADNPSIGSRIFEALLLLCPPLWLTGSSNRNEQEDNDQANQDLVYSNSELLQIVASVESPRLRALTSTVYINVNNGTGEDVEPSRFCDFAMGYAIHLQGVGTIHAGIGDSKKSKSGVARYPFVLYELRLIDLVESEILTIEEAIQLSTKTDGTTKNELEMKADFNKYAKIDGTDTSIMTRLTVNNNNTVRISEPIVRKVLHHTMRRRPTNRFDVCRDAWQVTSSGSGKTPVVRYYHEGGECPPGGYTINLCGGSYSVYFSNKPDIKSKVLEIDNRSPDRSGLAIHRGDSYLSTGCTTLYCNYANKNIEDDFVRLLYGTTTISDANDKKRLILACIDERHGLLTQNYNSRWYDIIAPDFCLDSISGPDSFNANNRVEYSLNFDKTAMAPGDIITAEEIQSIRWQSKIDNGGWKSHPNSNGHTQIQIFVGNDWIGKTLTVRACVSLSINHNFESEGFSYYWDHKTKSTKIVQ